MEGTRVAGRKPFMPRKPLDAPRGCTVVAAGVTDLRSFQMVPYLSIGFLKARDCLLHLLAGVIRRLISPLKHFRDGVSILGFPLQQGFQYHDYFPYGLPPAWSGTEPRCSRLGWPTGFHPLADHRGHADAFRRTPGFEQSNKFGLYRKLDLRPLIRHFRSPPDPARWALAPSRNLP